jgi:putative hemolysin
MSLLKTRRPATDQPATSPDQGSALSSHPIRPDLLPMEESIAGRYFMRFAQSPQDLEAVERLRFEVFNLELREPD